MPHRPLITAFTTLINITELPSLPSTSQAKAQLKLDFKNHSDVYISLVSANTLLTYIFLSFKRITKMEYKIAILQLLSKRRERISKMRSKTF